MFHNQILLITPGDPRGIGYEIILKILPKIKNFVPIIISKKSVLEYHIKNLQINLQPIYINQDILLDGLEISYPQKNFLCIEFDTTDLKHSFHNFEIENGYYSIKTLDLAINLIKNFIKNKIKFCLLTMPVSKNSISKYLNKNFYGHTEYISKQFGIKNFSMLMVGKHFPNNYYVLLITRHIPLKYISKNLRVENIVEQITNTTKFLETKLNLRNIEILICGLNPHNGENGKIGNEEKTILKKAVYILTKRLKNHKIIFPILTEKAFNYANDKNNVLIVTLYHDQAMVPLKLLCGHNIANITVGLPFIRISPGHGTGFDIAGKNVADIEPTIFCIEMLKKFNN